MINVEIFFANTKAKIRINFKIAFCEVFNISRKFGLYTNPNGYDVISTFKIKKIICILYEEEINITLSLAQLNTCLTTY